MESPQKKLFSVSVSEYFNSLGGHRWQIRRFGRQLQLLKQSGQRLCSPKFQVAKPKKETGNVALVLILESRPLEDSFSISVQVAYLDNLGAKILLQIGNQSFQAVQNSKLPNVWSIKECIHLRDVVDFDEDIEIKCEMELVQLIPQSPEIQGELFIEPNLKDFGCQAQMKKLLESETLSDFKIICQDRTFPVHKFALAARSEVFKAMLSLDTIENRDNEIHITDMNSDIVWKMIRFVYSDEFDEDNTVEETLELLVAADKYYLHLLKMMCAASLEKNLSKENAELILLVAKTFRLEILERTARDFI